MGRGDRRTRKGKIFRSSFGKTRVRKKKKLLRIAANTRLKDAKK